MAEAIRLTFDRRGTPLPEDVIAFTVGFADTKQTQWAAFRRRLRQDHVPALFSEVVLSIRKFFLPLTVALSSGKAAPSRWTAPGPWE